MIGDYDDALAYLDDHIGRGMRPGLDRIRDLLELMGDPQDAYPIIHVAGTNGKTSTTRMLGVLALAHGLTSGTFTSPHLERVEERITVAGRMLDPDEFTQAIADVAAFADIYEERTGRTLTYFELVTAAAFSWFATEAVDLGIVEVGLGGRLDATNVAHGAVSVVTGIGLDHTEILGDDPVAVANEKMAILEPGTPLVVGPLLPEVAAVADRICRDRDGRLVRYGHEFAVEEAIRAVGGWWVTVDGLYDTYDDLYLPVHGRHQTINLAVAVAALEALFGRALDGDALAEAVRAITLPGRMEPISHGPLVLVDGAHNLDGYRILAAALAEEFPTTRWVLVTASMKDKDVGGLVDALTDRVTAVVATRVTSSLRGMPVDDLVSLLEGRVAVPVEAVPEPGAAVERAQALAGEDGAVLVAGSLYLAGEVRSHLAGAEPVHGGER